MCEPRRAERLAGVLGQRLVLAQHHAPGQGGARWVEAPPHRRLSLGPEVVEPAGQPTATATVRLEAADHQPGMGAAAVQVVVVRAQPAEQAANLHLVARGARGRPYLPAQSQDHPLTSASA